MAVLGHVGGHLGLSRDLLEPSWVRNGGVEGLWERVGALAISTITMFIVVVVVIIVIAAVGWLEWPALSTFPLLPCPLSFPFRPARPAVPTSRRRAVVARLFGAAMAFRAAAAWAVVATVGGILVGRATQRRGERIRFDQIEAAADLTGEHIQDGSVLLEGLLQISPCVDCPFPFSRF